MKAFIVFSGLIVAVVAIAFGMRIDASVRSRQGEVGRIERDIARKQDELVAWEKWHSSQGVPLKKAYAQVFNDLGMLARVHRSSCHIKVDGANTPEVWPSARDSDWPGLKELKLQAVFSGFRSDTVLVAFLDAVDSWQHSGSVLIRRVHYEKSNVVIDIIVMGVDV